MQLLLSIIFLINSVLLSLMHTIKLLGVPSKNLFSKLIFDFKFFIFIYSKFLQFKNISFKNSSFATFVISKLGKSIVFNDSHPSNIFSILVIFEVSKLDKLMLVKLLHLLNILSKRFIFSVLKLEISTHSNDSQL